jgi:Protein of unknown function (DUF2442)
MKAIAPNKLLEGIPVEVLSAELIGEHKLRIRFSDGFEQEVDFGPFLQKSTHPAIRVFLDPERFKEFHIEQGDLIWGDWDLCFPIADLYDGKI